MIRALATLLGIAAVLGASAAAYAAIRAVGPADRTNEYGFGDAATVPPGGGTLFEARNFRRVVAALRRELGAEGGVQVLNVEPTGAAATARGAGGTLYVAVDASGRSEARTVDDSARGAVVPVARIDPKVMDRIRAGVHKQTRAPIERMTLIGSSREWSVTMAEGEPDTFVANLDGRGVRLPGEPNPAPIGAAPDSLLRAENLKRVLAAARREAGAGARVTQLTVRPERANLSIDAGGRTLALDYGYDAQLTGRDVRPGTGSDQRVKLAAIDPQAIERMAAAARKRLGTRGLADVQYASVTFGGLAGAGPQLLLYLPPGSDPPYVAAGLDGRGLTWIGRG